MNNCNAYSYAEVGSCFLQSLSEFNKCSIKKLGKKLQNIFGNTKESEY